MTTPQTPGGLKFLDTLIGGTNQATLLIGGVGALVALVTNLIAQWRAAGATPEEAHAAIAAFEAALNEARARNAEWLASHKRTEE